VQTAAIKRVGREEYGMNHRIRIFALYLKGRGSHAIDDFPNSREMTKTELQTALAEATQTDKRTAGAFLDTSVGNADRIYAWLCHRNLY
jgi:hypothetical protein